MQDYLNLPILKKGDLQGSLGQLYRVPDGSIRRVVIGVEMNMNQWGARAAVPERGYVHYRPVFIP
jgi:hypothetical protein